MKLEDLLEEWGTDLQRVAARVEGLVEGRAAVLGGSLVDDLGTVRSDIDVFTFGDFGDRAADTQGPVVGRVGQSLGPVAIDVYSVDLTRFAARNAALSVIIDPDPAELAPLPWLSYGELVALHAVHAGVALSGAEELDRVRDLAHADLLPLYLCLRALSSFRGYANDAEALSASADPWPALIAARHCAEAAVDLSLAHRGFANPNPKWRLPLALHAILRGALEIEPSELVAAMLPDAGAPQESHERCVEFARDRVAAVGADPLVRSYPQYRAAAEAGRIAGEERAG